MQRVAVQVMQLSCSCLAPGTRLSPCLPGGWSQGGSRKRAGRPMHGHLLRVRQGAAGWQGCGSKRPCTPIGVLPRNAGVCAVLRGVLISLPTW